MRAEMIDYQTRRVADGQQAAQDVPAADDRMVARIREALRDRQAQQAAGGLGGGL